MYKPLLIKDVAYKKALKNNCLMIDALIDEKENYAAYESGTRPINNKDDVEKYVSIAKNLGLGDIVEIECFDNIRLSVFSAAHARKNENVISYNSGKGMTREQAKMSAVMEFIERKSATELKPTGINKTYFELDKDVAIEPACLSTHFGEYVANSIDINWYPVVRITDGKNLLCPTIAVLFDYYDKKPLFLNNSNGLASGLSFTSAIVQGIYEVVERDGVSQAFATNKYYDLDLSSIDDADCKDLINQFIDNGIDINIKYVENEFNMPCFMATGNDKIRRSSLFLSGGFGCHSDKKIALIRAITELEQTRRVIYENKREDIIYMRPNYLDTNDYERVLKENGDWYSYTPERRISYLDIVTRQFDSMKEELAWQIEMLKKAGYEVFVANLSMSEEKMIPVVRVIIPGMENWYHDKKRIGKRLYKAIYTMDT